MKININGIKPEQRLFHNIWLDVYPTQVGFEEIDFWPQNYRTILPFDILVARRKKPLSQIVLEEITDFLVGRYELRLGDLAGSIEKNSVRVPLIILDDGTLLDGNRRFFACSYIFYKAKKKGKTCPRVLNEIPVFVIKRKDVDERTRQKILAEANFVEDYKVPWTLDVKAQVIDDFFQSCIRNKLKPEQAYEEIEDVYGEKRGQVNDYIDTIKLTKDFIESAPSGKKNQFREYVRDKFLYFWEFRNKALKGRGALDPKTEFPKVKKLFFKMVETGRFKNFKQVEPMIRAVRDEYVWGLLSKSGGSKIDIVEALYKEQRAVKSAEDKIRNFLRWLQTKAEPITFTKATFTLIEKLARECSRMLKKRGK